MKFMRILGFVAITIGFFLAILVAINYSKERDSHKGIVNGKPVTFSVDYATPRMAKRLVWISLLVASGIGIIYFTRNRQVAKP